MNINGILDTIRAQASKEYQDRIPETSRATLQAIGEQILNYTPSMNEFLTSLTNRIALTVINNKIAHNPLAILKKGGVPLGSDIQEIFINMSEGKTFDPSGANLLQRELPDVKALYYRMNRKGFYKKTITKPELRLAFTSYTEMETLITGVINSIYSGDNYDEFVLFLL